MRFEAALVALPWILLAVPLVLDQTLTGGDLTTRLLGAGLTAAAGAWVYLGHTRVDPSRRTVPGAAVHLAGLLALSAALIRYDDLYVIFAITGFFHSYHLRPWPLTGAAVLATSLVVNGMTFSPLDPVPHSVGVFVTVVLVQSAAITGGYVFSAKELERHDRQADTVRRLAAALAENERLHVLLVEQAREAGGADERRRLAGEIHDTLAQGLTGIVTQVQAAQRVWEDPGRARPHVDRALALARESLGEARRSVQALHPAELVESRLPEALMSLTDRWSADHDLPAAFEVTGTPVMLPPSAEIALFRTAQESLTNVARHARAARVGVTLSYTEDTVLLDVRDDGTGFRNADTARPAEPGEAGGFGLAGMRRRLAGVGGSLTVETAPGEGTAVSAAVPAGPGSPGGAS
ncbi:sensor histidine kinase [Myceligenerans sp. TRM 65318]|uniref:Sensor histidine kinase n=1 Tax=Myceligenerans pegani TaxID=2776917 RepID=A0ABR9MYS3_9MICO|nr:sensor histidine kinase [Myceligenerans sp. TRM 65318]MBE3018355.1 sensor histidine kinase [Myceligenerans sp. TRM 65318]